MPRFSVGELLAAAGDDAHPRVDRSFRLLRHVERAFVVELAALGVPGEGSVAAQVLEVLDTGLAGERTKPSQRAVLRADADPRSRLFEHRLEVDVGRGDDDL